MLLAVSLLSEMATRRFRGKTDPGLACTSTVLGPQEVKTPAWEQPDLYQASFCLGRDVAFRRALWPQIQILQSGGEHVCGDVSNSTLDLFFPSSLTQISSIPHHANFSPTNSSDNLHNLSASLLSVAFANAASLI